MFGRDLVLKMFEREGVEYIFGNPGTTEFGLIVALQNHPDIKYILALHEGVALSMAQMYANASGKTGVVNLHVAPGLGNALGSLYNAQMGKMPLLVTAGQQDTRMLIREPLLSYDLVEMAKPLSKWAVQIQHAKDIPVILSRAFKIAQDPPRGPVFVALPGDVLDDNVNIDVPEKSNFYRSVRPDLQGILKASELLIHAKNPVIICGDGVSASNVEAELITMAE
jgi:benzoylformate decarboxylase